MTDWHKKQVIYQIYPKSYQDSNDDGIGDIRGVIQRIPYLKELGVTTVWLNPIYVSPQVDNGYDVSDYYEIDESLGTMSDVDALIEKLHENRMYLLLDFVMNHTSDQHPWFQDAIHNVNSQYRNYYLWQDVPDSGALPNNWGSFFGGSVWDRDPGVTNQYYFHLFDKHMPDLNWKNQNVRRNMVDIAKFWVAKGIDGLRLDAFIHIDKADFKQQAMKKTDGPVIDDTFYAHLPHVQPYLKEFCHAIRQVKPDIFILGEAASASPELLIDYSRPENDECNAVITFRSLVDYVKNPDQRLSLEFQPKNIDVEGMKQTLTTIQTKLSGVSLPVLYWSNHDMARLASKYASKKYQQQSLKCLALMLYLQRGLPIIYYGEEIGMKNMSLDNIAAFQDLNATQFYKQGLQLGYSKENVLDMLNSTHKMSARGPMQWDESNNYGFSKQQPWIVGQSDKNVSVASEKNIGTSIYTFYKKMIALKSQDIFAFGNEVINQTPTGIFQYTRMLNGKSAVVTCNLTNEVMHIFENNRGKTILKIGSIKVNDGLAEYKPWSADVTIK